MCHMNYSYFRYDFFIYATWAIHVCDTTIIYVTTIYVIWDVWQCVAVCCSVLQCVAVCCGVLQCDAVPGNITETCITHTFCCSVLQCVAVCCSVLQRVAVCCSVLQCVAVCCSVLQCAAVRCSVLQYQATSQRHGSFTRFVAVCCSLMQCVAVWCSARQRKRDMAHSHSTIGSHELMYMIDKSMTWLIHAAIRGITS